MLALLGILGGCTGDIAGGDTPGEQPAAVGSPERAPPAPTVAPRLEPPARPGGAGGGAPPPPWDPGRVTLRRLDRLEYDNTVRDLLGTALRPAEAFPNDVPEINFSSNADELSLSPLLAELYDRAAAALADDVLRSPTARATVIGCDLAAAACPRAVLSALAERAWRRPVTTTEVDGLLHLVTAARTAADSPEEALKVGMRAVLLSPHFLFRVEIDPVPTSDGARALGGFELATRLSYFLWSTLPDDSLFASARAGKLVEPAEMGRQVARMLRDERARTFVRTFVGGWLGTQRLEGHQVDPRLFPRFDQRLAASMRHEAEALFSEVLTGNLSLTTLVDASFTFVDAALARHYGLPTTPAAGQWQRVSLAGAPRAGAVTTAAFLTATSHPDHTSVVKRGQRVMGQLLCAEPPPPPPDVPSLPDDTGSAGASPRALLEAHRAKPECRACHVVMDEIGIGLEEYDAVGAWRATDRGKPVDARGTLPDGRSFAGGRELSKILAADQRLSLCFAEHLLSYALGRSATDADGPFLEELLRGSTNLRDVVVGLVGTAPFRMRRGEPVTP